MRARGALALADPHRLSIDLDDVGLEIDDPVIFEARARVQRASSDAVERQRRQGDLDGQERVGRVPSTSWS
jgi:hypothetical protein